MKGEGDVRFIDASFQISAGKCARDISENEISEIISSDMKVDVSTNQRSLPMMTMDDQAVSLGGL